MSFLIDSIVSTPPIGSIIAFFGATDPLGWVICDGSNRNNTQGIYNNLINLNIGVSIQDVLTNIYYYKPPDLRGMFLRGTGTNQTNGLTTYTGPNIKSSQTDVFKSHSHTFTYNTVSRGSSASATVQSMDTNAYSNTVTTSGTGDSETRPVNIGVNWILKI